MSRRKSEPLARRPPARGRRTTHCKSAAKPGEGAKLAALRDSTSLEPLHIEQRNLRQHRLGLGRTETSQIAIFAVHEDALRSAFPTGAASSRAASRRGPACESSGSLLVSPAR